MSPSLPSLYNLIQFVSVDGGNENFLAASGTDSFSSSTFFTASSLNSFVYEVDPFSIQHLRLPILSDFGVRFLHTTPEQYSRVQVEG